ncbi:hypothetical protein PROFUN_01992 [Planoprotostelium fungivorum]|uniref:Ras-GAP domain-containing protein n=1 Tax=Planoprotostelium fungivorum TaxID=1890364 RepID=A0A2P6NB27_9EUKA|nr:hypothetical protein PROFUN_01992 [Planoprotostelium fungivorum]
MSSRRPIDPRTQALIKRPLQFFFIVCFLGYAVSNIFSSNPIEQNKPSLVQPTQPKHPSDTLLNTDNHVVHSYDEPPVVAIAVWLGGKKPPLLEEFFHSITKNPNISLLVVAVTESEGICDYSWPRTFYRKNIKFACMFEEDILNLMADEMCNVWECNDLETERFRKTIHEFLNDPHAFTEMRVAHASIFGHLLQKWDPPRKNPFSHWLRLDFDVLMGDWQNLFPWPLLHQFDVISLNPPDHKSLWLPSSSTVFRLDPKVDRLWTNIWGLQTPTSFSEVYANKPDIEDCSSAYGGSDEGALAKALLTTPDITWIQLSSYLFWHPYMMADGVSYHADVSGGDDQKSILMVPDAMKPEDTLRLRQSVTSETKKATDLSPYHDVIRFYGRQRVTWQCPQDRKTDMKWVVPSGRICIENGDAQVQSDESADSMSIVYRNETYGAIYRASVADPLSRRTKAAMDTNEKDMRYWDVPLLSLSAAKKKINFQMKPLGENETLQIYPARTQANNNRAHIRMDAEVPPADKSLLLSGSSIDSVTEVMEGNDDMVAAPIPPPLEKTGSSTRLVTARPITGPKLASTLKHFQPSTIRNNWDGTFRSRDSYRRPKTGSVSNTVGPNNEPIYRQKSLDSMDLDQIDVFVSEDGTPSEDENAVPSPPPLPRAMSGRDFSSNQTVRQPKKAATFSKMNFPTTRAARSPTELTDEASFTIRKREKRLTTVILSRTKIDKKQSPHLDVTTPTSTSPTLTDEGSSEFVNMIYSDRETENVKEIFSLMTRKNPQMIKEMISTEPAGPAEMSRTVCVMGLITGTVFRLVKWFIDDEFQTILGGKDPQNAKENALEKSLFSEESVASRFLLDCFERLGRSYTHNLFGGYVTQIMVQEKKQSLELNPSFTEPHELENNRKIFYKKVNLLIDQMTSQTDIDKIPVGIRFIVGYLHEAASYWKDKGFQIDVKSLVGSLFIYRYMCEALRNPEPFLKKSGTQSAVTKRNFYLLDRFFKFAATGEPHQSKEQFLQYFDNLGEGQRIRLHKFLQNLLVPSTTALSGKFPPKFPPPPRLKLKIVSSELNTVHVSDLHTMHRIFFQKSEQLTKDEENNEYKRLLDKLGSFQNKLTFSMLAPNDQKIVRAVLLEKNEESFFVNWVDKKSQKKMQRRLLVVGMNKILSITSSGKVAREGHYMDLVEVVSTASEPKNVTLVFKGFSIQFTSDVADDFIESIRNTYMINFHCVPEANQIKFNVEPSSRIRLVNPADDRPCGGFASMYKSMCAYYKIPVHTDLCWDMDNLKEHGKVLDNSTNWGTMGPAFTMDLSKYMSASLEEPLRESDLPPILHTLQYNLYFSSLVMRDCKLEKKEVISGLSEVFRCNRVLEGLTLSHVTSSKENMLVLMEGLSNGRSFISHMDLSNTKIEERAALQLAKYLGNTTTRMQYIDLSATECGGRGLTAIFNALSENTRASQSLYYLSISRNSIGLEGSNAMKTWLKTESSSSLSVLLMSGMTNLVYKTVVEGLILSKAPLQRLDLSGSKVTKGDDVSGLSEYVRTSTLLEELDLSSTHVQISTITSILTSVNDNLNIDLNLRDNNLSTHGATEIANVAYRISNIHSLDLSDNDLGDDGVADLALGLRNNNSIKKLYLNRNFKGKSKDRSRAVQTLIQLVTSDCTIEALHISAKPHSHSSLKQDLVPFVQSLEKNTTLCELGISGHQMGNTGAIALAKVLQINTQLTSIIWDENDTGFTGLMSVKYGLKMNKSIKYMPLPLIDIGSLVRELSREEQIKLKLTLAKIEKCIALNISVY